MESNDRPRPLGSQFLYLSRHPRLRVFFISHQEDKEGKKEAEPKDSRKSETAREAGDEGGRREGHDEDYE